MKVLKMINSRFIFFFKILICTGLLISYCPKYSIGRKLHSNIIENANSDSTDIKIGVFNIPESTIIPSPASIQRFSFSNSEKVIDYDVSPVGITVAAIVREVDEKYSIKFWKMGESGISDSLPLSDGLKAKAISWHPNAKVLFVMGEKNGSYQIIRIEKDNKNWSAKCIYSTPNQLRRLVVCPRPFIIESDYKTRKEYYSYRLFFGMDNGDKTYRIVSVTESGKRFYQVIGPTKTATKFEDADFPPSEMVADWALPIAFHPAGHQLIWEDKNNNFFVACYNSNNWSGYKTIGTEIKGGGSITPTPNGLGLLHWQKDMPGLGIYQIASKKEEVQLPEYHFISTPSSVPDGKGVVGLTIADSRYSLNYLPIQMPLADVVNAWMYSNTSEEVSLFQKNFGLFRPNHDDQMYKLYETENYHCNSYDRTTPTRPYLVTTDIFWELFGSAYQGLFIVKERDEAIPNFWKFVLEADKYIKNQNPSSVWATVFSTLKDINSGNTQNPEVKRILNEQDCFCEIIDGDYQYSDLKPRGHYTSTPEMGKYFKAFRYFNTIYQSKTNALKELNALPKEITAYAEKWIESYSGFISPSRSPLVWGDIKSEIPEYCKYPGKEQVIFPLSWGFDNEVLYSTVYHPYVAPEFRMDGRLLPSGLDLAAALGNGFAEKLLESDYEKYPNLRRVIDNLKSNFKENDKKQNNTIYSQWINSISVQWADSLNSTNGLADRAIWQTKRLQTGFATWTTLRHATILVNERTSAECGEGGFEEILMRAPRGYVEPDPNTFATIANLFETAMMYVSKATVKSVDIKEESSDNENRSLYEGIIKRLNEAANEARTFQKMAEKERRGETLTNEENEKILYVAGTAEHLFLVFNSLSNKDYALSNPDPIAKIADVAGGNMVYKIPYLMSAVGNTMEWNYTVPFFGRHQIVKGSIYSYYEFSSDKSLTDQEWREKVKTQEILSWIKPFVTYKSASGSPITSY
ncbi:MAG: DUF3160 domain-containing protein [Bacteroidia bacterium]|nr:DUF3160 domain-containing protein [Bacteroidia bacterium]